MFKKCKICCEWKTEDEFPKMQLRCKSCTSNYMKEWADQNRNKINQNQLVYQTTLKGRASVLLNGALARARKKNEEFKLTHSDVLNGISSGHCQKTLLKFDMSLRVGGKNRYQINPLSPSIDKINPLGIYEIKNVQYVCSWYNLAKGQMTEADMIDFCRRVAVLNP